jgi:hypothetical protein
LKVKCKLDNVQYQSWLASDDALNLVWKLSKLDALLYWQDRQAKEKAASIARQLAEVYGGDTEDDEMEQEVQYETDDGYESDPLG